MTTANEHVSFKFLKMERRVIDRMVVINKMDNVPLTSSHQTQ